MVQEPSFILDFDGYFCLDTGRIITGNDLEYLVGLMNSDLFFFAIKYFYGGGGLGKNGVRMKHTFFNNFSAYVPSESEKDIIKSNFYSMTYDEFDSFINQFIFEKYGVTYEEQQYIKSML